MRNLFLSLLSVFITVNTFGQQPAFRLDERRQYKEVKTINESVYLNGEFSHSATVNEKTATLVLDAEEDRSLVRSSVADSVYKAVFGEIRGFVLESSREYDYYSDARGNIEMVCESAAPARGNIAVFPDEEEP